MRYAVVVAAVLLVLSSGPIAQDATRQDTPRFRGGANLVHVDAYVTRDDEPVADLTAAEFEVLEDGAPQRIERLERIGFRVSGGQSAGIEPATLAGSPARASDLDARVFVLFVDVWHVSHQGSYRAQNAAGALFDQVIRQDDLIGIMTPEISARNLALAPRATSSAAMFGDNWLWGQRDQRGSGDTREQEIRNCYPGAGETIGVAEAVLARRRESQTLDALEDLIVHLETVRDERKFVFLLTEGWLLYEPDAQLARPLTTVATRPPAAPSGPAAIDMGRDGGVARGARGEGSVASCERERALASRVNNRIRFDHILQRANRANVSFYPVDPRGMQVFDAPADAPTDAAALRTRLDTLKTLAANTDGYAIVDPYAAKDALARMLTDTGTYYLLAYYSTNTKLDGKFRQVTVRVKRAAAQVRARPGYLAPTEADAASARVDRLVNGAPPGYSDTPPELRRMLETITPSRTVVAVRVQAAASVGQIWITTELDAAMAKRPEWRQGGRLRATLEHERGMAAPIVKEIEIDPGQRSINWIEGAEGALAPGRYVIRLTLTPNGGRAVLQSTAEVIVPDANALLSGSGLVSRKGPSTGLAYQSTADARYQRTERLRFEVPLVARDAVATARLLNRAGQTLPVTVSLTQRIDDLLHVRIAVADLVLAPLAQGDYVLEVAAEKNGKKAQVSYPFRVVP
jgi:VWFA-related protein